MPRAHEELIAVSGDPGPRKYKRVRIEEFAKITKKTSQVHRENLRLKEENAKLKQENAQLKLRVEEMESASGKRRKAS